MNDSNDRPCFSCSLNIVGGKFSPIWGHASQLRFGIDIGVQEDSQISMQVPGALFDCCRACNAVNAKCVRYVRSCSSGPEFFYRNAYKCMCKCLEKHAFRELLPLNFFLTAVRAWRPIVHLFVFESQKKKYCTLSNVRYRKKWLSITLSVSIFSLLYNVMC